MSAAQVSQDRRCPVFIVGCGRSGTTLLGTLVGKHQDVDYLNEPRWIWRLDPATEIWRPGSAARGRLEMTAEDVNRRSSMLIHAAFLAIAVRHRRSRTVEKLPLNAFRVGYLRKMFPRSLYVFMLRNPYDVATSIARKAATMAWWGDGGVKWDLLVDHANQRGLADLVGHCDDDYGRGLLEWRLATAAASDALADLSDDRLLTVRYEELTTAPIETCGRLENFLGAGPSPSMRRFAESQIRATARSATRAPGPTQRAIVGDVAERFGY